MNIYLESLQRRIVQAFADRRSKIERVELFTHEGRAIVITDTRRPRDITPMVQP